MAILKVGTDGKAPKEAKVGDVIVTAGGNYKITGGTAGNWSSEKAPSAGGGSGGSSYNSNNDYAAIIYDPNTTYEQKKAAYDARIAKEAEMRANGTWNDSWIPTTELQTVLRSQQKKEMPYEVASDSYAEKVKASNNQAAEYYKKLVQQGTDRLNAQKQEVNSSYDSAATNAYINYMQGQRTLPQQLKALGVTGGAAESSLIGARSGYESNLNQVNLNRQKALQDISNAIVELQNSGDLQTAQYILNNADKIADNYLTALHADINRNDTLREQTQQNAYNEAALTGMYQGSPTLTAWQNKYNRALEQAQITGDFSVMKQFEWSDEAVRLAQKDWLMQRQ